MFEILSNRSIVELSGIDTLQFLQNLTTNDIIKHTYCYTYMLNNQGRYLFDFFVYKPNEQIVLIDIDSMQVKDFVSKLILYKLRAKVDININNNYKMIYSRNALQEDIIYTQKDPRYNFLGFRSLVQDSTFAIDRSNDGLYMNDKYEFAIIDGSIDLIYNKSIPIEYGAEELQAINYQKGCYIGQEVISRTKYQGVVRKKIFKIVADKDLSHLPKGAEIKIGETIIGTCCSYYKNKGIALVREEKYLAKQNDSITIENNNVELVIPKWRQI